MDNDLEKAELQHLRTIIKAMTEAKNCLCYFSGNTAHAVGEPTFNKIEEIIHGLKNVYANRKKALRKNK